MAIKRGAAAEGLQGSWMDEKLALKFAAWLSPRFELWVWGLSIIRPETHVKE